MTRAAAAILLIALATGCDVGSIPAVDDVVRYVVIGNEVGLGQAFPLTVTRIWSQDVEPEPWNDAILAPLAVRLESKTRRENAARVEEVRRYRAYAFERDGVVVPPRKISMRPKAGGPAQTIPTPEIRLRVRTLLDPKNPGPLELPAEILPAPKRWPVWLAAGLAVLAASYVALRTTLRRPEPVAPPTQTPRERAAGRLRALGARDPATPAESEAWAIEASSILRDYLASELRIGALEMTTEEIIADETVAARASADARGRLASALSACDLVKFARHDGSTAERAAILDSAEAFIDATAPGSPS